MFLLGVLVLLCAVITAVNPRFLTLENFFDLLRSHAFEGILAVGLFVVILSGGIDVSFSTIAVVGMYFSTRLVAECHIDSIVVAFAVSAAIGILLGAVNALLIGVFKIPTFIATLGTSTAFHGALMVYAQATRVTVIPTVPDCYLSLWQSNVFEISTGGDKPLGFSWYAAIFIVIAIVTGVILRRTTLGRSIRALGGNAEAARRVGFNIPRIQFFIYCYVGFLSGIAGVIIGSYLRYVNPLYIVGNEMLIVAAVVLGGASIVGGKGSVVGTLLGVALLTVTNSSLEMMKIPSYFQQVVTGAIIIIGVGVTSLRARVRSRVRTREGAARATEAVR